MIDWNEMVVYCKVVETGSFVGAARALGLPKSTVSRKVAGLEERLGVRLLHRTTRVVRTTPVGHVYFERCARLVSDAEEADRLVTSAQERPTGLLRITTSSLVAERWLCAIVADYLSANPDVRVDLMITNRMVDLVDEGYDVALRAGILPDGDLVARRLQPGRTVLVASPAYLERRGVPRSIDDLSRHDCVIADSDSSRGVWSFGDLRLAVSGRLAVNDIRLARDAALAGLGIARLPSFLVGEDVLQGRLLRVLPQLPDTFGGLYAVYPSRRHLSTAVRSFVDFCIERFRAAPPWTEEDLAVPATDTQG